jgi:hypothetical protein
MFKIDTVELASVILGAVRRALGLCRSDRYNATRLITIGGWN